MKVVERVEMRLSCAGRRPASIMGLPSQITTNGWLKTTETYPLTILAARKLKSRYQQGPTPFEGL